MFERYRSAWRDGLVMVIVLLLAAKSSWAQLGVGGGFDYGTAAFIGNRAVIKRPSLGIAGMLSYAPRDSKLFPSFTYLLKVITVPVDNTYYHDQNDQASTQHFVLNLNYRAKGETDYHQFFIGVGVAKIKPYTSLSDNGGRDLALIDSGAANLYPMAQLGARYMHRILGNSSFYVGLEGNIKYIRMHSGNEYYLQQGAALTKASISGDIIFPAVQLQLDYFFDGNER